METRQSSAGPLAGLAGRPPPPREEGGDLVPVPLLQQNTSESCSPAPTLMGASLIPPPGRGPPPDVSEG